MSKPLQSAQSRSTSETMRPPTRIVIVGAGYVGLVTAACLTHLGHCVTSIDVDATRISSLRRGVTPISEPGLAELIQSGLASGRLAFGTDLGASLPSADVVIVAVGTLDAEARWTDENVRSVLSQILGSETVPPLTIIRSTLRPGSMRGLQDAVDASDRRTSLVLNPEFTRQGSAIADFLQPHRIVVGTATGQAVGDPDPVRMLYAGVTAPYLVVDHGTAELIKIGANAFLAAKITFANELARVASGTGADIARVIEGIGLDPRIGQAFLQPGPGFGGSCLPNQIDLLSAMSDDLGLGLEMISAVQRSNRSQPRRLAHELLRLAGHPDRIAVLGLAFKANTDDTRESPALRFIEALGEAGVSDIRAFDPAVRRLPPDVGARVFDDPYEAAADADVLAVATEWPAFKVLDWRRLAARMRGRLVFDTRAIVDAAEARSFEFDVRSPGSTGVAQRPMDRGWPGPQPTGRPAERGGRVPAFALTGR